MLAERYELLDEVGSGQSATVYRALDSTTNSIVAIKILKSHLQTDAVSLERFRREIQITRHIQHPGIVSIFDLVRDGDRVCLVMEYLKGGDLKAYLKLNHPLPMPTIIEFARRILHVLSACHARGVIHRDLKPQNIFVTEAEDIRLLDFGISRMTSVSDLTRTGTALGSPEYMAPELFASNVYDSRSDLYALGVVLYEMTAGQLPFRGDSLAVLYRLHREAPVPDVREVRPEVPEWLQRLFERLLVKARFRRYQTAGEVLADIEAQCVQDPRTELLEHQECFRCGEPTIAELSACICCGRSLIHLAAGTYDLLVASDEDKDTLRSFAWTVFGAAIPTSQKTPLFLSGVDAPTAAMVRGSAKRHGVVVNVQYRSPYAEVGRAVMLSAMCLAVTAVAASTLTFILPFGIPPFMLGGSLPVRYPSLFGVFWKMRSWTAGLSQEPFQALLAISWPLLLAGIPVRKSLLIPVHPLILSTELFSGRRHLDARWLDEVLPHLAPERTPAMKAFVSVLIEQYIFLRRSPHPLGDSETDQLRDLLARAAELASLLSEMEILLQSPRRSEIARKYGFLEERVKSSGGERDRRQCDKVADELRDYYAIEEKHEALLNRLVTLQALFNRVLARAMTETMPVDDAIRGAVRDTADSLATDLAVAREVRHEIESFR